jgi:hypothetical protein
VIPGRAPYHFDRDMLEFQKVRFLILSKLNMIHLRLSAVIPGRAPYYFNRASLGFRKLGILIVSKLELRKSRLSAVISGRTPYVYFLKILRADFGLA